MDFYSNSFTLEKPPHNSEIVSGKWLYSKQLLFSQMNFQFDNDILLLIENYKNLRIWV